MLAGTAAPMQALLMRTDSALLLAGEQVEQNVPGGLAEQALAQEIVAQPALPVERARQTAKAAPGLRTPPLPWSVKTKSPKKWRSVVGKSDLRQRIYLHFEATCWDE